MPQEDAHAIYVRDNLLGMTIHSLVKDEDDAWAIARTLYADWEEVSIVHAIMTLPRRS